MRLCNSRVGWLALACLTLPLGSAAAQIAPGNGSRPADHLTPLERADFALGRALFERPWANGRSSSSSSDGLGPLFNARACSGCHHDAGRSDASVHPDSEALNLVLEVLSEDGPHPVFGKQLQVRASPGIEAEGSRRVPVATQVFAYPDGETVVLRRPLVEVSLTSIPEGGEDAEVDFAPRVAPQIWTASAIEAIPQAQVVAWADPDDADGDGISGRVRWVFSLHTRHQTVGRFGWKATTPSLEDQIANAFATDMGLSNPLILADQGDCTPAQEACVRAAAYADDPDEASEVRPEIFDLVVAYNRGLATPEFTGSDELQAQGGALFDSLGCSACHRRAYDAELAEGGEIDPDHPAPPYTDLLLHDLGPGLADTRRQGGAAASEWRTAPLLGLGQTRRSNPQAGYLHDGRALTIEEAVLWHGGEAHAARDAFAALPREKRQRLIEFLENL